MAVSWRPCLPRGWWLFVVIIIVIVIIVSNLGHKGIAAARISRLEGARRGREVE